MPADTRRYRLTAEGYRICLVYLELFERIYAPLTSGIMAPAKGDRLLPEPAPRNSTNSTVPSYTP